MCTECLLLVNTLFVWQDTILTAITAYLSYFIAERGGFRVSGVLCVLTIGVLMAGFGLSAIKTDEGMHMLHSFWTLMCWIADTVIFVLAGVIIVQQGFLMHFHVFLLRDWGYLFALYGSLLGIRAVMIAICSPVMRYTGNGMQARTCTLEKFSKYMFLLSWGTYFPFFVLLLHAMPSLIISIYLCNE
jgi:NhaP-type Na+/H+ or K+/H+ antiporter